MATRSNIGIEDENTGFITSIYCHWDGYLEYNGRILLEKYNTPESVRELISFGGVSSLGKTLEDCVFYCRDRGESLTIHNDTFEEFSARAVAYFEYIYVFRNIDGVWKWFVSTPLSSNSFHEIKHEHIYPEHDEYTRGG
jgi:hypothetical protein